MCWACLDCNKIFLFRKTGWIINGYWYTNTNYCLFRNKSEDYLYMYIKNLLNMRLKLGVRFWYTKKIFNLIYICLRIGIDENGKITDWITCLRTGEVGTLLSIYLVMSLEIRLLYKQRYTPPIPSPPIKNLIYRAAISSLALNLCSWWSSWLVCYCSWLRHLRPFLLYQF